MNTLNFIITDAGRQAAIDADNLGIKLTITDVAYGTGNWSPDKTATALQNEFKRLVAGGENPAPLYVHIAVTDQSLDTYQANEVSIYAGDVLFAIWSKGLQPDMDGPGKINTGDSAFVFDLLLENVPPDSVTVGDANFSNPLATETKVGVGRVNTQKEVDAGEDDFGWVTAKKLKSRLASFVRDASETIKGFLRVGTQEEIEAGESDSVAVTPKKMAFGFILQAGSNGYIAFPKWLGRFIIQWARVMQPTSSITSFNADIKWPIVYPTECYVSVCSGGTSVTNLDAHPNYRNNKNIINMGAPTRTGVEMQFYIENYTGDFRTAYAIGLGK